MPNSFKITGDQMNTAIILADRIRRQQQLAGGLPNFRVDGYVDPSAPIEIALPPKSEKARAAAFDEAFRRFREDRAAEQEAEDVAVLRREREEEVFRSQGLLRPKTRQRANAGQIAA